MRHISIMALLALLLAGCGGDFASPTTTDYQTTTTTTTTAATAELSQDNNRPLCAGILNIGSCNVVQVSTQHVNRPAGVPAPAPSDGMTGAQMVGTLVLLCLAFIFVVGVAGVVMGDRGYN